jgi:hypothetical protein
MSFTKAILYLPNGQPRAVLLALIYPMEDIIAQTARLQDG